MLKAVLIDSSGVARGLLSSVLHGAGYEVCGQTHTGALGLVLLAKHQPQLVCIAREQMEDGSDLVRSIRQAHPKTLIFMVSGEIDAATLRVAHASGVNGFIVKPFNADTVLKTIRNTALAMVRKQQAGGSGGAAS